MLAEARRRPPGALTPDRPAWVWSDLHLHHRNIIGYTKRPLASCEQMDRVLHGAWRQAVGDDDYVLCGGDVALVGSLNALRRERVAGTVNVHGHAAPVGPASSTPSRAASERSSTIRRCSTRERRTALLALVRSRGGYTARSVESRHERSPVLPLQAVGRGRRGARLLDDDPRRRSPPTSRRTCRRPGSGCARPRPSSATNGSTRRTSRSCSRGSPATSSSDRSGPSSSCASSSAAPSMPRRCAVWTGCRSPSCDTRFPSATGTRWSRPSPTGWQRLTSCMHIKSLTGTVALTLSE